MIWSLEIRAATYAQISARQCAGVQIGPHSTLRRERFLWGTPGGSCETAAVWGLRMKAQDDGTFRSVIVVRSSVSQALIDRPIREWGLICPVRADATVRASIAQGRNGVGSCHSANNTNSQAPDHRTAQARWCIRSWPRP